MKKAEPQEATAVRGASSRAPIAKSQFIKSPKVVGNRNDNGRHGRAASRGGLKISFREGDSVCLGPSFGGDVRQSEQLGLRRQSYLVADEAESAMTAVTCRRSRRRLAGRHFDLMRHAVHRAQRD